MDRRSMLLGGTSAVAAAGAIAGASFLPIGSSASYAEATAAMRAPLRDDTIEEVIRFAALAANGHNTQPWRFRIKKGEIDILPDFSRETNAVDPDDHHLYVSLGCAGANLALASQATGRPGELHFRPSNGGEVDFDFVEGPAVRSPLLDAIPVRQSTRADYSGQTVSPGDLKQLEAAAKTPGVDLVLLTARTQIERIRELVVAGNGIQMSNSAFMTELKHWLRFNPRDALASGDGLYSAASGNPVLPHWLGERLLDVFFTARIENEKYARQIHSSSGIVVFAAEKSDPEHWVRAGHACQKFALQATVLGLKHAFINQPVEVSKLRPELASLIGLPGRRPNIVMRFGYGPLMPYSPRRPVEAILER